MKHTIILLLITGLQALSAQTFTNQEQISISNEEAHVEFSISTQQTASKAPIQINGAFEHGDKVIPFKGTNVQKCFKIKLDQNHTMYLTLKPSNGSSHVKCTHGNENVFTKIENMNKVNIIVRNNNQNIILQGVSYF